MPSNLKQLNVRLTEEDDALMTELLPKAREATGLAVSQSDLFRLALRALKREYEAASPPALKGRRR